MPLLSVGVLASAPDTLSRTGPTEAPARSAYEAFAEWVAKYAAAGPSARRGLLTEGRELAVKRRAALVLEIKANPRRALEAAVPWGWRQRLPLEITRYLEEFVNGRGDLEVYCALPNPGADYRLFSGGTLRYATVGGRSYRAYVYGRREHLMTQRNIPLHGIAIDGAMAVHEDPLRVLGFEEARQLPGGSGLPATTACAVCGVRVSTDRATLLDLDGHILAVCQPGHAAALNRTLAAAEERAPLSASTSGIGGTLQPPSPVGSFGLKKVIYMRLVFPDDAMVPISEAEATDVMNRVNDFYIEASYNKTALISTITPVLTLPQPKLYYSVQGPGAILADAVTVARAAGYDANQYDFKLLRHPSVPGFDWGGLGGGGVCWLQGSGLGLVCHELGHNYGLAHANFWDTRRAPLPPNPGNNPFDNDSLVGHESIIGPGMDIEYGDVFDVMGSGGGETPQVGTATNQPSLSTLNGHFNVVGKSQLGWLPEAYIVSPQRASTNRIYVFDAPQLIEGRSYALKVPKDIDRTYWVSARSKFTDNPWLLNGVELHWGSWQQTDGYSELLDTSPNSKRGSTDAPLPVGRTYADSDRQVFITPIAKGGLGGDTWFDVVVNYGPFPSNLPPSLELSADTLQVNIRGTVNFTAAASDLNGDAMAYFWDFGDGTFAPSSPMVSKSWTAAGDYVVRCEVSDLKGGLAIKHLVVRVGSPNTLRVSGQVIDAAGFPLAGVVVHNGSLTNNDYADDYTWTYTDSDGAFTLVGLTNASYAIGAYLNGYTTKPANFDSPLTLSDQDAVGLLFRAFPWVTVGVVATTDADKARHTPGQFTLFRTGDTNTVLHAVFRLGGTASTNDYLAPAATESETNVVPTPFGPRTNVFSFYYVDFPTGVVTTNLIINPSTNAPATPDEQVELAVMYPVQAVQIMLTNIGGNTLTNTNVFTYPGWVLQTTTGPDTWFQTQPTYRPAWQADSSLALKGSPAGLPTVSIVAVSGTASENAGDAGLFTVTRFGRLDLPVTVTLQTSGSAVAGSDYEALPPTVTIPAGQTFVNVPVFVRPNLFLQGNRTVTAVIAPSSAYQLANASASVLIVDNDMPSITIDAPVPVASEATGSAGQFRVTRTGDLVNDLIVNYLVTGTAVGGQDYRSLSGTVTIPAGRPSAIVFVAPRNNFQREGDLSVVVFLSDRPNYNVGSPNAATVIIQDAALATVSVSTTVANASEGSPGQFTVQRVGDLSRDLLVNFVVGGTAKPLADYTAIPNYVRIPAGSDRATVSINPLRDGFKEDPETVILSLLPGANYNVGLPNQAELSISDDDGGALPGVGFNFLTSSVSAGDGQALVAVSITANPAADAPVTVDYKITGGTAIADVDYPALSSTGRLVFVNGPDTGKNAFTNRTQVIKLPILDSQTNARPDRTAVLSLLPPAPLISNVVTTNVVQDTNDPTLSITNLATNLVVVPVPMNALFDVYTTHTLTILDDASSVVTIESTVPRATEEDGTTGLFTIRRQGATNRAQVVNLFFSGAAVNGDDYQTLPNSVVIPAGADSLTLPVVPLDDGVQEYMQDVKVILLNAPGAKIGSPGSASVLIVEQNGTIEFTATSYSAPEGIGVAQVPVRRTSNSNVTDTVTYSITPGTAVPGLDFIATNGVLTFLPGQTQQFLPVTLLDDARVDPGETILLTLVSASGGLPFGGQSTALLTIEDDDSGVEFTAPVLRMPENGGTALVSVHRIGIATNALTVDFVVTNGTAIAGKDFVGTNGTLTFVPGQTQAVFQVTILDNTVIDGDRTAKLWLTNVTGGGVLGTQATADLSIVDDDCALQFGAPTYTVEEYGRVAQLNVVRVGGTVNPVSVDFATSDGTAQAGRKYQALSGTLSFAGDTNTPASDGSGTLLFVPGETNKTIHVRILDEPYGEGDQTFNVTLTNPRGPATGVLPGSTVLGAVTNAVVTILDDELPGRADFEFNPGDGTDGPVFAVAVQPDGNVLIGGGFSKVDQISLNHVARLHADGYLDSSFNPGLAADDTVFALALQPDGRVLIGGDFTNVTGIGLSRVARLNADGTRDAAFDPGVGADATVRVIAVQPDGSILLGGAFSSVGGYARPGLARLTLTGAVDVAFSPGSGLSGDIWAITLQPDGKVLIGGNFAGGAGLTHLARLNADGSVDSGWSGASSPSGIVHAIVVQPDGHILIGGEFSAVGNAPRSGVARLNADGSVDGSFNPGPGANGAVFGLGLQPDGKVLVAGAFTQFEGMPMNRFARLNPDGTLDSGYDIGAGANGTVRALALQPDTAMVIGGDFTSVRGLPRNRVARVHGDDRFIVSKVQFTAATYAVPEDAGQIAITVVRSGDLQSTAQVAYATADGTARAGVNYQATSGTLAFGPGDTQQTFNVPVINDGVPTGDLTVNLLLTNLPPTYSLQAQLTAILTIADLESTVAFGAPGFTVNETDGQATITVRRTGPNTNAVTVDFATRDGTATNGVDYTAVNGTLTFKPGETNQTFSVPILDDQVPENDKTVLLELSNPTGGAWLGGLSNTVLVIVEGEQSRFHSLNLAPPIGGTVTPSSGPYPTGTSQLLVATPDHDYQFVGWTGSTNSVLNPLLITMDRDYVLTANFRPVRDTYTFDPPFDPAALEVAPWANTGDRPWQIQPATPGGSHYVLRSGPIQDSQQSLLSLTVDTRAGAGSFALRVSSEAGWDFLEFYVNGRLIQRWSGDVPWQTFQFALPVGQNRLIWRYVKDANFSAGLDAAFLDHLYLPLNVPDQTPKEAHLTLVTLPAGGVDILLQGKPGLVYILQATSSLTPPGYTNLAAWVNVSTNFVGSGTLFIADPQATNQSTRFYRAFTP